MEGVCGCVGGGALCVVFILVFILGSCSNGRQGKRETVFITTVGRSVDKDERLRNYRHGRGPQVVQAPLGI